MNPFPKTETIFFEIIKMKKTTAPESANVIVCVRIRPLNDRELVDGSSLCFLPTTDNKGVQEIDCDRGHTIKYWNYDHTFGPDTSNKTIFDTIGSQIIDAALNGYNSVLFAYGQTSSGKTYTLFGEKEEDGLVAHALDYSKTL